MGRAIWPAWAWYLVVLTASIVGYFGTPDTWAQTICYDSIALSGDLTTAGKLVAIGYPVLDLLLLALLARMLVGGGARNGAFRLLAAGMISYLAADYAWAFTDHFEFEAGSFTSHLMDAG